MADRMTSRSFALPDLGEGLSEAELLEWLVAVGDEVRPGQAIARIETDKAEVDVTSPWTGRIVRLHGEPGARLHTGQPLVDFALPSSDATSPPGDSAEPSSRTSSRDPLDPESDRTPIPTSSPPSGANALFSRTDAGTVVGTLPLAPEPGTSLDEAASGSSPRAVPAARARARELGVALDSVDGTGPNRVITRADVERRAARSRPGTTALPGGEPLRGVRLAMARKMARSNAAVAAATIMDEADVGRWWTDGADVMPRLVRAIVAASAAEPALNAWLDGERMARALHSHVDLAVAIQSPDGLFAPVLRDVGRATPERLRAEIDRLVAATHDRSLAPTDLQRATFTLSNFGRLGGRHAMLVIVPPQVAILGAGRIEARVVARDGHPVVRSMLPLSLGFDHRAVTGAEAAGFLGVLRADLERHE